MTKNSIGSDLLVYPTPINVLSTSHRFVAMEKTIFPYIISTTYFFNLLNHLRFLHGFVPLPSESPGSWENVPNDLLGRRIDDTLGSVSTEPGTEKMNEIFYGRWNV